MIKDGKKLLTFLQSSSCIICNNINELDRFLKEIQLFGLTINQRVYGMIKEKNLFPCILEYRRKYEGELGCWNLWYRDYDTAYKQAFDYYQNVEGIDNPFIYFSDCFEKTEIERG